MVDCIVVGAGPAGAAAAWSLARSRRRVLVLEGASWPRSRACGGGIAPVVAQWFDFDLTPARVGTVQHLRLTWKLGDPVAIQLDPRAALWAIDRGRFDDCVIQAAIALGATFCPESPVTAATWSGTEWTVTTASGTHTAPYLIMADGPTGQGAAWLNLEPPPARPGLILEAHDPNPSATPAACFDFGSLKNGAVWSIPLPDRAQHMVCAARFRGSRDRPEQLEAAAIALAENLGLTLLGPPRPLAVRLWDGDRPLHSHQAVLAGDAAGIADPFSGEGVRPALWTGLRAAEAIDAALGGDGAAIARYSQTVADGLGRDMAWAKRLSNLFNSVPKLAYKIGTRRPSVKGYIGKMICGELQYTYVADRAIKRLTSMLGGNLFKAP